MTVINFDFNIPNQPIKVVRLVQGASPGSPKVFVRTLELPAGW
jgi:hypothetical protein